MFYTTEWKDVIAFGTGNTFDFFTGAIKGINKLMPQIKKGMKLYFFICTIILLHTVITVIS